MAQNPQGDFDEDWDWPAEQETQVTSPIAGSSASVEWGINNVRRLVPPSGSAQISQSTQENPNSNRLGAVARGRGIGRRAENGGPSTSVPNSQPEKSSHAFNFKSMADSLARQKVTATGDAPQSGTGTGFSFCLARATLENDQQPFHPHVEQQQMSNEFEDPPSVATIDGQVSELGRVLQNASVPTSVDHMHKLAALRQDPNHPLYSITTFENLDLKVELKSGLSADHKCKLSAIQEKTLPVLISPPYRNCIAQSQNGTGKTVTFVVTMLNRVDFSKPVVQAVCLLPTKELAQQVVETLQRLGRFIPDIQDMIFSAIRDSKHPFANFGTEAMLNSDGKLRTPIVVGTAGTVNSLMRKSKQLVFDDVILFVVDEADKMLERQSENFFTTIENIDTRLSNEAQRIFFSATFSTNIVDLAKKFMSNPLTIRLRNEELSLDNIRHFYLRCRNREDKLEAMKLIYNAMVVGQSIVFCRTRHMSHWLCTELRNQLDFRVAELSGDMEPRDRDEQISRFRRSADRVLVTTNLSARGLDISSVNLIINWDPPINHETRTADFDTYLHRVGRSGRFGADGVAVNMVERESDMAVFRQIENHFGIKVEELSMSSYGQMEQTLRKSEE